jgi:hypothetical protein
MENFSWIKQLISIPDQERNAWQVIGWWELRRLPYNLIVGLGGSLGLLLFVWFSKLPPKLVPEPIVGPFPVILFAVGANFFYTSGWVAELMARAMFPEKAPKPGPQLLVLGSLLSVMLAIFPGVAALVAWVWRASAS